MSLVEKRARKAEREAARIAEKEKFEEEALDLEEKFEGQGLKFKVDFDVVTTAVGNFVVRNPDFVVAKQFNLLSEEEKSLEDLIKFVDPCIAHPDSMTARTVLQAHGGIAYALMMACLNLHAAVVEKKTKK